MPRIPKTGKKIKQAATNAASSARRVQSRRADKIRKRFRKARDKYDKLAEGAEGLEKARYKALRDDLDEMIDKTRAVRRGENRGQYPFDLDKLEAASADFMASSVNKNIDDKLMRGAIGKRVYAATIDLWRDRPEGVGINDAIMQGLGVDSMDEVIEYFWEEAGDDFFEDLGVDIDTNGLIVLKGREAVSRIVNANV